MNNKKIISLTSLRFIMCMIILVSHLEFLYNVQPFGFFYKTYLHNPTFAVDFFFILSGFGMMLSNLSHYEDNELLFPTVKDSLKYGINHVKKIYPIYISTIIFGLLCDFVRIILLHRFTIQYLFKRILQLLINIPLLQSLTGMMAFIHPFNGVTWFLSTLFIIYIFSPFCMYKIRCLSSKNSIVKQQLLLICLDILIIVFLKFVFVSVENYYLDTKMHWIDSLSYASPYIRVFYVLIGMHVSLIFYKVQSNMNNYNYNLLELLCFSLFIMSFLFRNSLPNGKYLYVLDCILCATFVFVFSFEQGFISERLNNKTWMKLGNISMYIFLVHYPIRIWLHNFVRYVNAEYEHNGLVLAIETLIIITSSFLISLEIDRRRNNRKK